MINKVVLVGRLTRDVNFQKTSSGLSVARFTVACNRVGSRSNDGQNATDFISCVAWRQSADYLSQYAKKGDIVGVEGRITTGSYDNANGQKVYTTDVTCDRVTLIGSNRNNSNGSANNMANNTNYSNNFSTNTNMNTSAPANDVTNDFSDIVNGPTLDISSDDLPF